MNEETNKEITLKEMQSIELEMLKYLHKICTDNDLTYYLYGGTLLGAVRHQGFIPWDDDLDIIVPRKDYERLIRILKEKEEYKLLSYEYVEDYYYPFAKLVDPSTKLVEFGMRECSEMGVWVDIFPLDVTSKTPFLRTLHIRLVRKLVGMNRYKAAEPESIKRYLDTPIKRIRYSFTEHFNSHKIIKWIHRISGIYRNRDTGVATDAIWGSRPDLIYDANWFGEPASLPFEGTAFYVPSDYKALLIKIFGDYMKLPPESKRYSEHLYSCWRVK